MRRTRLFVTLVVVLSTAGVSGQRGATAFAPDRLARIDDFLQRYVQENRIPGAVALVLRDGRPVYEKAVGWSDKEAGRRMTPDTLFRIASQSKAITSAAVMILLEEGRLALASPASEFIPAFEKTTVAVQADAGVTVVPAKRRITVFDLLTHTAGISYGTDKQVAADYEAKGLGPAAGFGWYTADKDEPVCATMERLASVPFVSQPGEAYVYGYNTDVLGCIVERASGMPLDRFIEARITGPLGMKDTHFFIAPDQRERLAAVYASGPDGRIVRAPDGARGQGHYVEGPRKNFSGGAGLVSTARDYARFLEMVRRGGELDGVRILSPRSVALMTSNQIGTLYAQSARGLGYGLAFESVDRYGANGMASVGSFSWGGAYATRYHVDPEVRMTLVFMMQVIPNTTDVREKFQNLVYSALIESKPVTSEQR
jgi:CubicO group peptidase (beta-lactamase class C family)